MNDREPNHILNEDRESMKCRVLSYNVFMRPSGISSDKLGDLKNERLSYIISKILPKYDIICFQEIFTKFNCRRERLITAAKEQGYTHFSIPPEQPFFSFYMINSGLLTLSRHQITVTDFIPFDSGSGVDRLAYKGIMYSRLNMGKGNFLNLFNVHLQAHYHHEDKNNISSRLNQIAEMRCAIDIFLKKYTSLYSCLEEQGKFNEPIYLIGDFNVCANKHLFPKDGYLRKNTSNLHFLDFIEDTTPDDHQFSEYDYLLYMLKKPFQGSSGPNEVTDMLRERYGHHPVTFIESIHNTVDDGDLHGLTAHDSMDFIFQIIPPKQELNQLAIKNSLKDTTIQPFPAEENQKYKYVSDHLGIEFSLKLPTFQSRILDQQ